MNEAVLQVANTGAEQITAYQIAATMPPPPEKSVWRKIWEFDPFADGTPKKALPADASIWRRIWEADPFR
jgi:hypothetical protein